MNEQQKLKAYLSFRIREYLEEKDISQKEFAYQVGATQPVIGSYVEQRAFPREPVLSNILRLLGLKYEDMVREAGVMVEMK